MQRYWVFLAIGLACLGALWPPLALAAVPVLVFAVIFDGKRRLVTIALAVPLIVFGLYRFVIGWMMPNLVSAGQRAAEERAVSRLREILWAERKVRELGYVDSDGDHEPEYALLGELLGGPRRSGVQPEVAVLRAATFPTVSTQPTIVRAEGYYFALYLPSSHGGASDPGDEVLTKENRLVAYAWPATLDASGRRVFAVDEQDRVCESFNTREYSGTVRRPTFDAAPVRTGFATCGVGGDGEMWRRWRRLSR